MPDQEHIARLRRDFGPAALGLFEDPAVSEIYVNCDGRLRFYHHVNGRQVTDAKLEPSALRLLAAAIADRHGLPLGAGRAELSAELPREEPFLGARVQFQFPPVSAAVALSIRKPPAQVYPLASYLETGVVTPKQHALLVALIERRSNVLVIGATHSGKTTLLNALLAELAERRPAERVVALEDTLELRITSPDHLILRTHPSPDPASGEPTTLRDLVHQSLRHFPDRLVIGEIRDEAAQHLIEAWETGHCGYSTLHAATPEASLERLDYLCRSRTGHQRWRIAQTIHHVVLIRNTDSGRRVESISKVRGLDASGRFLLAEEGNLDERTED